MTDQKKRSKRYKPDITIGTDPEFALVNQHRSVVRADQYIFFESKHNTAKIGSDGAGTPVEIRPSPVKITETAIMVQDIYDLFTRIAKWTQKQKKGYTINGGAMGGINKRMPIGSHIHFGGTEFQIKRSRLKYDSAGRRDLNYYNRSKEVDVEDNRRKLVKCLDIYFIPIANFFISNEELYRRRKTGYGMLGEYRDQKWGIEYRTPYCFLLTPLLTSSLYALASLIAYNYKKIIPDKNLHREATLYYDFLGYADRSLKIQRSLYKKTKPKILKIMSYNSPNPKLNSHIISLFNLIERNKTCKSVDILKNYNFDKIEIPPFTVHYTKGNPLRRLRQEVEGKIKNDSYGEIYIYIISYDLIHSTEERRIILQKGMPNIDLPRTTVSYEKKRHDTYKYSIGLSEQITYDIGRSIKLSKKFAEYLSKLRFKF